MRALILALVIGVMSLGSLTVTPASASAQEWRGDGDTVAVRWRGWSHYRHWGSRYYYPSYGYWGGAYYSPSYYYAPSYYTPSYYYGPGYSSYYYSPYVVPTYRYYRPGVSVFVGW